jgi:MYXO-CTERM domain-containing protein
MKTPGARWLSLVALAASLAFAASANAVTYTVSFPLDGTQEIPANASTATGSATLTVDTAANTINYTITHTVVGPTASHIHGPAARDKSAGVIIGFPSPVSPMTGTLNYTSVEGTLEPALLAGRTYVNVHSGAFPGGEIRGQIPAAPAQTPSLTEWGMIALALGLLGLGSALVLRRRRVLA